MAVLGVAHGTVNGSVVRATQPRPSDQGQGVGIVAYPACAMTAAGVECYPSMRPSIRVTGSVIEHNHDAGLNVSSADAWVERSVVRATQPRQADLNAGHGIYGALVCNDTPTGQECDPTAGAAVSVTGSVLTDNHSVGVLSMGSQLTMDATVLRSTWPRASDQVQGSGIEIQSSCWFAATGEQYCDPATRGTGSVTRSLIEQNHEVGLFVMGSDVTVDATVLRSTHPRLADHWAGLGISSQLSCFNASGGVQCDPNARASTSLSRSLVEDNRGQGLLVVASDVTVDATVVRATLPYEIEEGVFGDGIALLSWPTTATATITNAAITDNARAGLGCFGGFASLADTHIRCAAFELSGEPHNGLDFQIEDQGGNRCGCGATDTECKVVSAGLEPPTLY